MLTGPEKLAKAKEELKRVVEDLRDLHIKGGFTYDGDTWDSDEQSQINIIGANSAVSAGIQIPSGFTWRSATNIDHPFTATKLAELGAALLVHKNTCYQVSWYHKTQIDALNSIQQIEAYDVTTMWPGVAP